MTNSSSNITIPDTYKQATITNTTTIDFDTPQGNTNTKQFLKGKKVSIIGDSISTFKNYIPNDNRPYSYPSSDVTDVNQTWWMDVINQSGATLGTNDSWSGRSVAGNPEKNTSCLLANLNTIDKDTDLCLILLGVNDFRSGSTLNAFDPTKKNPNPQTDYSDALCVAMETLAKNYPNTRFAWISPIGDFTWPAGFPALVPNRYALTIWKYDDVLKEACKFYGNHFIDMRYTFSYLQASELMDGLHPKAAGMRRLSRTIIHSITNIL
ncbi:SGNH/GDSL hydrolase family protein [Commensalibacter papalotli (ex Servin-Garciduenas et al. 2014)]|uniref:GDSL-like Lipase/Acylhydrolase n=1 Tax=Commensalibacter papalotli (ex Servin-Garciduenas et al. 2014) TaxID=1208583 RepID=W7E2E1_9PROT|nr:SGNH/GDSL hydrolase family protein [Commensalibacter papalotli (ex Servin-Garciduenas et al. 2014)]EUK19279.1 GDSL-like Lipase/Acylhydrolase [Commensalibacter papalotli (ex Servin-Garciduenas et al. 2014)]